MNHNLNIVNVSEEFLEFIIYYSDIFLTKIIFIVLLVSICLYLISYLILYVLYSLVYFTQKLFARNYKVYLRLNYILEHDQLNDYFIPSKSYEDYVNRKYKKLKSD